MNVAKKNLEGDLSSDVSLAMFVSTGVSLFVGSAKLDEEVKSDEDQELAYRSLELNLVLPAEFLALSDIILDAYISIYRNKREELKKRRKRGETVKPSEIMEIRDELMDGLEEYNNVSVFRVDPYRRVMEYGKERLGLQKIVNALLSGLQELSEMARTLYDEEISKKQTDISRKHAALTAYFGVFGALGSLLLLPQPFNVVVTVASLSYPVYELLSSLYRRMKG
jgi:hypothetical protein